MSENVHSASDLKQMQSLPLRAKIIMTQQRIRQWYEYWDGKVYLSFSGGKDSTVLRDIISNTPGVWDVPSVFCDTGLEYPEVRKFATELADVVIRPEMRFDEVIKEYGYPVISKLVAGALEDAKRNIPKGRETVRIKMLTGKNPYEREDGKSSKYDYSKWGFLIDSPFKISNKCCDVMKKKPFKTYEKETQRVPITATMADESISRKTAWLRAGCNAFDSKYPKSQPMSFWTEQDVLQYIKERNLPIANVYGNIISADPSSKILTTTGCKRTGCMFCMFGCHLEAEPNRFQMMRETHPRQYDYCINGGEMVDGKLQPNKEGLGLGKVLDYIGVKYD